MRACSSCGLRAREKEGGGGGDSPCGCIDVVMSEQALSIVVVVKMFALGELAFQPSWWQLIPSSLIPAGGLGLCFASVQR